jgi:hypothetical protein
MGGRCFPVDFLFIKKKTVLPNLTLSFFSLDFISAGESRCSFGNGRPIASLTLNFSYKLLWKIVRNYDDYFPLAQGKKSFILNWLINFGDYFIPFADLVFSSSDVEREISTVP